MSRCVMPKRTSPTSFAVLGLLSLRSWTTYELAKQAQRSLRWFWPRAERKLYDEPKRLAAAGYATATEERTGRRRGTRYAITPQGRRALADWLDEPPDPPSLEFEGMIKVFFADAGSLDQLRGNLELIADRARDRLAALETMVEENLAGTNPFPERRHLGALTLPYRLDQERSLLRWASWALEQIDTWNSTTDPGGWQPSEVLERLRGAATLPPAR
jgi:PadR family transcriptional regulator AphA